MNRSLLVFIASELRLMFATKTTLFWIFLFPFFFLAMMLMSYGSDGSMAAISLEVDDQDRSAHSSRYVALVKSTFTGQDGLSFDMQVSGASATPAAARTMLLTIPAGFGAALARGEAASVQVRQTSASLGNRLAARMLHALTLRFNADAAATPMLVALDMGAPPHADVKFSHYMLTGILVLSIMASAMSSTCITLAERRERNVFKLMAVLPVSQVQYLVAMLAARVLMLGLSSVLLLLAARLVFNIELELDAARLAGAAVIIACGATVMLALGTVMGARLASVPDAVFVSNFAYLSLLFLSDLTMPLSSMSPTLRYLTSFLPTSQFVSALRNVLIGGEGLLAQGVPLAGMLAWTLLFALLARLLFRWHKE